MSNSKKMAQLATDANDKMHHVQCKLSAGPLNDPLEKQADDIADKVISIPESNFIQRKFAGCKEEQEALQRKPLASFIQRKESSAGTLASDAISNRINASKGNGINMDSNTQSFMQSRFGADFSDVKIHTGSESIQMNHELNAKAFTVGNDIYFNEGQYNPGSNDGKHLLAHELTHTVQQGERSKNIQKADDKPKPVKDAKTGEIKYQFLGKWYEQKHFDFFSNAAYETMKASLNEGFGMMGALFIIALITTESGWGKGNGGEQYHNLFSIMGGEKANIGTAHGNLRKFSSYEDGFKEGFIKRIVDGVDAAGKAKFPDVRSTLSKNEFTIDEANQAFGQFTYYSVGKRYSYEGDGSINWAQKYFKDMKRTTVPFMRNELSTRIDFSQKLMQMIPDEDQVFVGQDLTKMNGWQADVTAVETAVVNQLAAIKK